MGSEISLLWTFSLANYLWLTCSSYHLLTCPKGEHWLRWSCRVIPGVQIAMIWVNVIIHVEPCGLGRQNSLNFDSKKSSVITMNDHLKILSFCSQKCVAMHSQSCNNFSNIHVARFNTWFTIDHLASPWMRKWKPYLVYKILGSRKFVKNPSKWPNLD